MARVRVFSKIDETFGTSLVDEMFEKAKLWDDFYAV